MDVRRTAYDERVFFGVGDDTEGQLHWYIAPPGAEVFSDPTVFRSFDWSDPTEPAVDRPGIVRYERGTYTKGQTIPGYKGKGQCGQSAWFLAGIPSPIPPNPVRNPAGVPECCTPERFGVAAWSGVGRAVWTGPPLVYLSAASAEAQGLHFTTPFLPLGWRGQPYLWLWVEQLSGHVLGPSTVPFGTKLLTVYAADGARGELWQLPVLASNIWTLTFFGWVYPLVTLGANDSGGATFTFAMALRDQYAFTVPQLRSFAGSDGSGTAAATAILAGGNYGAGALVSGFGGHEPWDTFYRAQLRPSSPSVGGQWRSVTQGDVLQANANQGATQPWAAFVALFGFPQFGATGFWRGLGAALWHGAERIGHPVAMQGTGSLVWATSLAGMGAAALSGTGAASWTGTGLVGGAAALSGTGSSSWTGTGLVGGAAALSGTGSSSWTGTGLVGGAAALSGTGSSSWTGTGLVGGAAALSGTGSSSWTGTGLVGGDAALSGTGSAVYVPGGPKLVAGQVATNTGTTSVSCTWPAATTAGHLLVAIVGSSKAAAPRPSITPPAGWTYANDITISTTKRCYCFFRENAASQSSTGNFTTTGSGMSLCVAEFSGIKASGSLDRINSDNNTSSTANSGGSGTTSQASEVAVAGFGAVVSSFSAPSAGYAIAIQSASAQVETCLSFKVLTTTAATSSTCALSGSVAWGGIINTFEAL